jgi:hypothetical protein
MMGYYRMTRKQFYAMGGFSDSFNVRKQLGRSWSYWRRSCSYD